VGLTLEQEIRELRERLGSEDDPEGRAFAPLADALRRAGRYDEAAEVLEDGCSRHPDFPPGHLVTARLARERGAAAEAEGAFRHVLALDPGNAHALAELAGLLEEEGRPREAADLLHRLWWLDPRDEVRERLRNVKRLWVEEEFPPEAVDPESESEEARVEGDEGDDDLVTRTVAELYARQGHLDRAIGVLERLLAAEPDDADLRTRLDELRSRGGRETPPPEERVPGKDERVPGWDEDPAPEEVERLAREWYEGPGVVGELGTPFAWTETEEGEEEGVEPPSDGPTVAEHFRGILEWVPSGDVPGGVPSVEALEPDPVPIEALEPDPVPIGALAPEPAPAPSGGAGEDEGEAPPEAEPRGEEGHEPADSGPPDRDDEFRRWLDELGP